MSRYIVAGIAGPMHQDPKGILWFGRTATIFPNRDAAQEAVRTSQAWGIKRKLRWDEIGYEVYLVKPPPKRRKP